MFGAELTFSGKENLRSMLKRSLGNDWTGKEPRR